jgi:hypothetical protein
VHSSGKLTNETVDNTSQEGIWAWVLQCMTGISSESMLEGLYQRDILVYMFTNICSNVLLGSWQDQYIQAQFDRDLLKYISATWKFMLAGKLYASVI